jgi:HD superfamily phosphohydrolase
VRIRDPIHGTITVSAEEIAVIDSRFFQRLRNVRQLGFGELAFPGATHTRHAHSLGAMHVASRLFEGVAARSELSEAAQARFRAALRVAALCHDLGHMPFSHASESIAPARALLKLPAWTVPPLAGPQATHEDFTTQVLLDSSLTPLLREAYARHGLTPEQLASLVTGREPPGGAGFTEGGVDWAPLLHSLVSGELDADRMDYLLRDSFHTGVNYGRYDFDWISSNLNPAIIDGRAVLALSKAAAFAFEDFLLSRYHMFVSVYLHHTAVSFDHMLQRYYQESPGEFEIPSDPEAFLLCDDVALLHALRLSKNRWAERIVTRRGFKLVAQFTERDEGYDLQQLAAALTAAGLEHFEVESKGVLSKYTGEGKAPSLHILDVPTGRLTEISRYTPLYQRYSGAVLLSRVYVRPDQAAAAAPIVAKLTGALPRGGAA